MKQTEEYVKIKVSIDELINIITKDVAFPMDNLYELAKFSKELVKKFEKENGDIPDIYTNKDGCRIFQFEYVIYKMIESKIVEVVKNCYPAMSNATNEQIYFLLENAYNRPLCTWIDMMDNLIESIELIEEYNELA